MSVTYQCIYMLICSMSTSLPYTFIHSVIYYVNRLYCSMPEGIAKIYIRCACVNYEIFFTWPKLTIKKWKIIHHCQLLKNHYCYKLIVSVVCSCDDFWCMLIFNLVFIYAVCCLLDVVCLNIFTLSDCFLWLTLFLLP